MSYINAEKVLPAWLIDEIRNYISDGLIYIPPAKPLRKEWGSKSGIRELLAERNSEIRNKKAENVYHIWNECCRVLKKGGRLLAGFDNGISFLFEGDNPLLVVNRLPFNPLKMPNERFEAMAKNGEGIQFSHSLEEQIDGQLKAGFTLKALYEDRDRVRGARIRDYSPQYMATLAVK